MWGFQKDNSAKVAIRNICIYDEDLISDTMLTTVKFFRPW